MSAPRLHVARKCCSSQVSLVSSNALLGDLCHGARTDETCCNTTSLWKPSVSSQKSVAHVIRLLTASHRVLSCPCCTDNSSTPQHAYIANFSIHVCHVFIFHFFIFFIFPFYVEIPTPYSPLVQFHTCFLMSLVPNVFT